MTAAAVALVRGGSLANPVSAASGRASPASSVRVPLPASPVLLVRKVGRAA